MLSFKQWLVENHAPDDYSLEHKFSYYNSLLFENRLPHDTPVQWTPKRGAMGVTNYTRNGRGSIVPGSLIISISTVFKRNEQQIDATLVHEMIHAYLAVTLGDGDGNHGRRFQLLRSVCIQKTGLAITEKDTMITDLELANSTRTLCNILLLKAPHRNTMVTIYRGTPFEDHKQQNALEAFWGVPGRLPAGTEIQIIKLETDLGQKYGYAGTLIQKMWKELNSTELEYVIQHGQLIRTIQAGSVSHEHALEHLPSKEAIVMLQYNSVRNNYTAAFYNPNVSLTPIETKLDRYHRIGSKVELLRVNSPLITQGLYVLGRGEKSTYYTLSAEKVAAMCIQAITLRKWS